MSGLNSFPQQFGNYPNISNMFNNNYQEQLEKYLLDQAVQRNQQQIVSNMDFIPVSSEEEAEKYIVKKGETLWFRHSSEPEIYVKSVSSIGEPNFGAYNLVKKVKEEVKKEEQNTNISEFVTVEKLDTFESSIKGIMNEINKHIESVEQKIEKMSKNEGGKKPYYNSTQTQKVGE